MRSLSKQASYKVKKYFFIFEKKKILFLWNKEKQKQMHPISPNQKQLIVPWIQHKPRCFHGLVENCPGDETWQLKIHVLGNHCFCFFTTNFYLSDNQTGPKKTTKQTKPTINKSKATQNHEQRQIYCLKKLINCITRIID